MLKNNKEPNKVLAKVLAESIKNSKDGNGCFDLDIEDKSKIDKSEGMIIGLHTDWGGGKTTLIEDLKKDLGIEKDEKNKPPYFFQTINAWEFNKENKEDLWKSIISFFYLKIIDDNTSFIDKHGLKEKSIEVLNLLLKIGFSVGQFKKVGVKGFDINKLFSNNYEEKLNELKDNISLFYSMKDKIKEILNIKEKEEEDRFEKYILVIDDLDRCSPKEVVNLLDSLKIFLDLPNVIVIVAVDRRHIEKGIYEVYNKENGGQYIVNPDEYLEKIIHLPIDLFLFDDDIKDLNKGNKESKKLENETDLKIKEILQKEENKDIIDFGLSNNPRKILRFNRLFKFYYNVFKNLGFFNDDKDNNEFFLIFELILKLEWGDYFKKLISNPILLKYVESKNEINIFDSLPEKFYELTIEEKILKIKEGDNNVTYLDLLNNFEKEKLKRFVYFLRYIFENSLDESLKINHKLLNDNIILYFLSFQYGKDIEKNSDYPIIYRILVNLFIFKDNFLDDYIKILIDMNGGNEDFSKHYLSNFENSTMKDIIEYIKENEKFKKNQNIKDFSLRSYIEDNDIDLSEYGLGGDGEMITGLVKYIEAKEEDEKRFGLGSKIFFDKILSNFDKIYNLEINNGENKQESFRKINSDLNNKFYGELGEEHILNNLENGVKRTMFGEIINQMSFAKFGPSMGGMVGATDFIQLENIVISNIENANNKNEYNIKEWKKIIRGAIILDTQLENYKNLLDTQLENYKKMLDFIEGINDEAKSKVKRLKKRLLYIFSHFWALQDIEKFPVYYGKSREGLSSLGIWSYKYGDLEDAIDNYKEFSEQYGKIVEELREKKLADNFNIEEYKETLNNKFDNFLGKQNDDYIENYYYYKIIQDLLYNV